MTVQQPEYINTTAEEATAQIDSNEAETLPMLPPAAREGSQWQRISKQVSVFLVQLPDYINQFFNEYKQPLTTVGIFIAALIVLRTAFYVLNELNNIPLVGLVFESIGAGYLAWFIYRYLLKASTRQELLRKTQALKEQVVGRGVSSTTDAGQVDEANSAVPTSDNCTIVAEQPASTIADESATASVLEVIPPHPPEGASPVEAPKEETQAEEVMAGEDTSMQPENLEPEVPAPIEPVLSEQKAVAQAVEAALAATTPEDDSGEQELVRPHPPAPELVEAAIHDAEEKSLDFSPPETGDSEAEAHSNA